VLSSAWLESPLGPILAIADDHALVLLEFEEREGLETELSRLRARASIVEGRTALIEQIETELREYFAGERFNFETHFELHGTEFQERVWRELLRIPPGETRSYLQLAEAVGRPTAVRAVARANGANPLAIVVPCHRVIGADGALTGYGGGVLRKRWLLDHEFRAHAPVR